MTIRDSLAVAISPALGMLPARMDSPEARAMLIAIALQESALRYRRQIGGPARGFWEFEQAGVSGVLQHPHTRDLASEIMSRLTYGPDTVHAALEHNDVLAAAMARLLLWTIPERLPKRSEQTRGLAQYLSAWMPGKPRPEKWADNYAAAWNAIEEIR